MSHDDRWAAFLAFVGLILIAMGGVLVFTRHGHGIVSGLELLPGGGLIVLGVVLILVAFLSTRTQPNTRTRFNWMGLRVEVNQPEEAPGDEIPVGLGSPLKRIFGPQTPVATSAFEQRHTRRQCRLIKRNRV